METEIIVISKQSLKTMLDNTITTAMVEIRQELEEMKQILELMELNAEDKLMTAAELAVELRTTAQNVYQKKDRGIIPYVPFGGKVLFSKNAVIKSLRTSI